MKEFKHPNIVSLLEQFENSKSIFLVLELCNGGDLSNFIRKQDGKKLSEECSIRFLYQLCCGLLFLRENNIIHRDLKPANILLTEKSENAILKLADFGFARMLESSSLAHTHCGTPLYMAPEIFELKDYDNKADIWSIGCIFYEMLFGFPPYSGLNHKDLLNNIRNKSILNNQMQCSEESIKMLRILLVYNPIYRASLDKFYTECLAIFNSLNENNFNPINDLSSVTSKSYIMDKVDDQNSSVDCIATTNIHENNTANEQKNLHSLNSEDFVMVNAISGTHSVSSIHGKVKIQNENVIMRDDSQLFEFRTSETNNISSLIQNYSYASKILVKLGNIADSFVQFYVINNLNNSNLKQQSLCYSLMISLSLYFYGLDILNNWLKTCTEMVYLFHQDCRVHLESLRSKILFLCDLYIDRIDNCHVLLTSTITPNISIGIPNPEPVIYHFALLQCKEAYMCTLLGNHRRAIKLYEDAKLFLDAVCLTSKDSLDKSTLKYYSTVIIENLNKLRNIVLDLSQQPV